MVAVGTKWVLVVICKWWIFYIIDIFGQTCDVIIYNKGEREILDFGDRRSSSRVLYFVQSNEQLRDIKNTRLGSTHQLRN